MPAVLSSTVDADGVTLAPPHAKRGVFARLIGSGSSASLADMSRQDWALGLALADLRALAEEEGPDALEIGEETIRLSHPLAARLDGETAGTLGLPPMTDLVFETGVSGILGDPGFRLDWRWSRNGRPASPGRTGAILHTEAGDRRMPRAALDAIAIAERFDAGGDLTDHWSALARFRRTLRPDADISTDTSSEEARIAMTGFLDTLRIASADAFALHLRDDGEGGVTFDPVPFSRGDGPTDGIAPAPQLEGAALAAFQREFDKRGSSTAYPTGENTYLIVERSAAPVLSTMARKHRAPAAEREAFALNPVPALTEAIEAGLVADGALELEDEAGRDARIEEQVSQAFVQDDTYLSARVVGVGAWRPPDIGNAATHRTTWLPETFTDAQRAVLDRKSGPELEAIRSDHKAASAQGVEAIDIGSGVELPVGPRTEAELEARIERTREAESPQASDTPDTTEPAGQIVLETKLNFDALTYGPSYMPRAAGIGDDVPDAVTSTLMPHQTVSFDWQVAAWRAGLPGLLNADEPGLGKTLQTLSFLAWLRGAMAVAPVAEQRPVLIVAPTSLLMNWEKEVATHLDADGLGTVLRLYGAGIAARKIHGAEGHETDDGEARLDFSDLQEAIADGRGHNRWVLTTYQTLTNYHHSFARVPFAAAVFDEIQALKNPATLAAAAARAMDARFRIGLTGTPIENRLTDLWAIMDQLAPGTLATLRDFRDTFDPATEEGMVDLNTRIFGTTGQAVPPLGIRRLKKDVASDLLPKQRLLHPRIMPPVQAACYEEAHEKAASSPKGGALKALQHIRSVSAHPGTAEGADDMAFVAASARMVAAIELLRWIHARGERVLVFIEHVRLQHRFAEIVRRLFDLAEVPIINGSTPTKKRQPIVDHFQRHLAKDEGFDVLILAPRAAGTGLTLTAACHVVHLSRWWNPAVEEQCNDRTHRIGQTRAVTVHLPLAIHPEYLTASFDCLLHDLMRGKRGLAEAALWPAGDVPEDIGELLDGLASPSIGIKQAGVPDAVTLHDDAVRAGFYVEALAGGGHALRSSREAKPLEVRAGASLEWSLGHDAAARIALGATADNRDKTAPPLTALDGGALSLWPRYVLDG